MNPLEKIHKSWEPVLPILNQEPLLDFKQNILPNCSSQPLAEDIFNVFRMPVKEIKVVILGQDPYPTPGDAIGYSFATRQERKVPRSLKIIQKEIIEEFTPIRKMDQNPLSIKDSIAPYQKSISFENPEWKTLSYWRQQGVFLLNTALTVETGKAGSHLSYWKYFIEKVINFISEESPCIWLLWGKKAQSYRNFVANKYYASGVAMEDIDSVPIVDDYNYILEAPHPAAELYSGGNAGFYGCNHFIKSNKILEKSNKEQIVW